MQQVVVGILIRDGKVLVCQRRRGSCYQLHWEFPGGKLEIGEPFHQTLERELREELGVTGVRLEKSYTMTTSYSGNSKFNVTFCFVRSFEGTPMNKAFEAIRWVTPSELRGLDMLEGNKPFIDSLLHEVDREQNHF